MATYHSRSMLIAYVAIFLLSLNGLFANSIALDAVSITQIRSVIAALAIFLFCLYKNRRFLIEKKRDILLVYFIGIVMGLHWVTFFHAMQVSSVAVGMLALYTFPVMTVFLEPFFNRQRLQVVDVIAACVVAVGIMVMTHDKLETGDHLSQGLCWGILSALLFSLRNLLQKYRLPHLGSDNLMLHQLVAIALMLLLFIDFPAVNSLAGKDMLLLIILGLLTTAAAHTLLVLAFKRLPAKTVAMVGCLQPVIAAILAWLILGEQITVYIAAGGMIILGVAIYASLKKVP